MVSIILRSGFEIKDAETVISNYASHAHGLFDPLSVPEDDSLDLASLAPLAFFELNNPPLASWREIWNQKDAIDDKLRLVSSAIPITAGLIPWKELDARSSVFLKAQGFSRARTSKILHKKRPNLVPIFDSRVVDNYYLHVENEWGENIHRQTNIPRSVLKTQAAKSSALAASLIKEIRLDILQNLQSLESLRQALPASKKMKLSHCRILDIVLWEQATPSKK